MASKRVLIVGGVAGGASCAARLRRLDEQAEIIIYERSSHVAFANCGLPYYVGGVIPEREDLLVASPEQFQNVLNVEIHTRHEVQKIDRAGQTIEVRNLDDNSTSVESYDVLVLAPGAAPIRPPLPGINLPGIFSLRNMEDMDRIHERVAERGTRRAVVVGAGYIGLEMVENLRQRNVDVAVVELLDQVMPPMDPEMVTPIQDELRERGVELCLSDGAASFEQGEGDAITVVTQSGRRLDADVVILAIGVKPDVKLARDAGLQLGEYGGIRVNAEMRTSDPAIWAVGDAVEVRNWVTGQWTLIPLAGPANRQGRLAADVIAGRNARFRGSQGTGVVGLFDLTLAITGTSEKALKSAGIPYKKMYVHLPDHAEYYPDAQMIAMKLLFDPTTGRLFGAQAVGKAGVEKRIDVVAMAIQKEATIYDLEEAELCYAPQYGSAKDLVNIIGFASANWLHGDVDVVHWEDWHARMQSDAQPPPVVVDVRPPEMIEKTGEVPGTLKIPLGQFRSRLGELPKDREIWVHCGFGKTSYFAYRILIQNGFTAKSLAGGYASFKQMPTQ